MAADSMLTPLIIFLSLILLLPEGVHGNCHDHRYGAPSKSCKRIKDEKFQVRGNGIKIVPMWEYILLKEETPLRVKRSTVLPQRTANFTMVSKGQVAGVTGSQPPQRHLNLAVHRFSQSAIKTHDASMPSKNYHNTLIQPVDSNAPAGFAYRQHPQAQPSILRSSIFSANVAHHPHSLIRSLEPIKKKSKRQEAYPTTPSPVQAYPSTPPLVQHPPPPPPGPESDVGQYGERPGTIPSSKYVTNASRKPTKKLKSKSKSKSKANKKKSRKEKHRKKMCKKCHDSDEEDSEEKEMACEWCRKSKPKKSKSKDSKSEKTTLEDKERGLLQSALKVQPINGKKDNDEDDIDNNEDTDQHDHDDDDDNDDEKDHEEETEEIPEGEGGGNVGDQNEGEDGEDEEGEQDEEEVDQSQTSPTPLTTTVMVTTPISIPTILDYVERAKQNKLMRIPVYRGKQIGGAADDAAKNETVDADGISRIVKEEMSEFATNIRDNQKPARYSNRPNVKYSYPPKDTLPLQTCFHNPSGYVCCNLELNNVVEATFKEVKELPNFNPCNLQLIANKLQRASEKMFGHPFETIVSHADFAQNINFAGDLVCKLEIDGKYMITYATPYHADDAVGPQGPDGKPLPVRSLRL